MGSLYSDGLYPTLPVPSVRALSLRVSEGRDEGLGIRRAPGRTGSVGPAGILRPAAKAGGVSVPEGAVTTRSLAGPVVGGVLTALPCTGTAAAGVGTVLPVTVVTGEGRGTGRPSTDVVPEGCRDWRYCCGPVLDTARAALSRTTPAGEMGAARRGGGVVVRDWGEGVLDVITDVADCAGRGLASGLGADGVRAIVLGVTSSRVGRS